jgi:hypothetical protein
VRDFLKTWGKILRPTLLVDFQLSKMPATSAPLTRKQRRLAEKRLKKVRRIAFQAKKSVRVDFPA